MSWAVIESLADLVMLGLLPSAISLILFIYLMLTWTSLQLTMTSLSGSPFARFRIPFAIVAMSVVGIMIGLVIAIAASSEAATRQDAVVIGSYVLAALYAVVCFLVLLAGFGLRKSLGEVATSSSSGSSSSSRRHQQLASGVSLASAGGYCLLWG